MDQSNRKTFLETIQISGEVEIEYLFAHMNVDDAEGWDWVADQGVKLGCTIEEDFLVVPALTREIFVKKLDAFMNTLQQVNPKKKKS